MKIRTLTHPLTNSLSLFPLFYFQNGAYYDWYAYEPDITSKGVPQDVLTSLFDTFRNGSYSTTLPVKHVMLDAYWMNNLRPDGNCKVNDSFWTLPFPRPEMLSSELGGAGVILYNGPQCAETSYAEDWPLVYSLYWNEGWGSGTLSEIAGVNSSAFYTSLFSKLSTITNLTGFTQDFLDFHHLLFPAFLEDAKGNDAWQSGQAEAALNAHLPVQYCMAEPSDLLNSVRFNAVTNARASQDYGAGSGSSWRIASTSLLLSAIGLRASKDNFWSGSSSTDRGREPSPFLSGVVTALSHGPVGFADKIFEANPNVLLPTINQLGTILHASRPATWLDAQWHGVGPLAQGDVRLTHSVISEFLFYSLLAVELGKGIVSSSLTLNDLYPLPSASLTYAMWQYNNSACFTLNSPASQCITSVGGPFNGNLIPAPPVPDETLWELWSLSPILSNGKIFLGEYKKYVAVSPNRFSNLQVLNSQVCLDIVGAPNEMLTISWISNEVVGMKDIVLQKDGTLTSCF